jgi:hypothetical protein
MDGGIVAGVLVLVALVFGWTRLSSARAEKRSMQEYGRALGVLGDVSRRSDHSAVRQVTADQAGKAHVRPEGTSAAGEGGEAGDEAVLGERTGPARSGPGRAAEPPVISIPWSGRTLSFGELHEKAEREDAVAEEAGSTPGSAATPPTRGSAATPPTRGSAATPPTRGSAATPPRGPAGAPPRGRRVSPPDTPPEPAPPTVSPPPPPASPPPPPPTLPEPPRLAGTYGEVVVPEAESDEGSTGASTGPLGTAGHLRVPAHLADVDEDGPPPKPRWPREARTGGDGTGRRVATGAAAAVALLAVALLGWKLAGSSPHRSGSPPATTPARHRSGGHHTTGSPTTTTTAPSTLQPTSTSSTDVAFSVPTKSYVLTFDDSGTQGCWIGVQAALNGPWLWMTTLGPGQSATYSASGPTVVRLGAPRYVGVKVNGITAALPGYSLPYDLSFSAGSGPAT